MKHKLKVFVGIITILIFIKSSSVKAQGSQIGNFNKEKDLLLVQFDCKTDVDDLHTVAALSTLLSNADFSTINYHAVAGTYGVQEGLYVPPNNLFQLAFETNWTDAHQNRSKAVEKVKKIAKATLLKNGDIWIAEAGQSDFTAKLIEAIQKDLPKENTSKRIHVVQHSDWNEEVTSKESLQYVKRNADYIKIPDGNAVGNGTPGFKDPTYVNWKENLTDKNQIDVWQLAVTISDKYNGKDGRYTNTAILSGGLDFSDLSEVCWILGVQDIKDVEEFFQLYAK